MKAALLGVGTAVLLSITPAGASEMDDLKAQIEALKERLGKLDGGTSVTVSGYVKGDFYIDSHDDQGPTFNAPAIRLDDAAGDGSDDGSVGMHARQTRFRLGTSTETPYGALNTVVETDFYGAGNVLRLRQAYGELGPVLAGQAWSVLGDDHTGASTVDFDGPVGVITTTRTTHLRLGLPLGEGFTSQIALEPAVGGNELPTFLAALRYSSGWGAVNLTGAVGRNDAADGQTVSAHALHFGAHLNATDSTQVMVTFNSARGGLNGRIWGGSSGTAVDASGDLKARETMGGFAGVSHGWSDRISSGLYFGWVENDTDDTAAGTNAMLQTVHANVFWSPVPAASIGFEIMHGWRETSDATKGEATRAQLGVQYSF